jgi:ketosteroid isomerase-like protein
MTRPVMPLLPLAALALLALPACNQDGRSPDERHLLEQLEHDWGDAYVHGDVATLDRILADDFIGRWADGSTSNKREELASVRSGHEQQQSNQLLETKIRLFGDTAVVTWKTRETRTVGGKDASGTFWGTDVFVKRAGRWQAVAAQTSRLESP